jgi:hypothetical protein
MAQPTTQTPLEAVVLPALTRGRQVFAKGRNSPALSRQSFATGRALAATARAFARSCCAVGQALAVTRAVACPSAAGPWLTAAASALTAVVPPWVRCR